MSKLKIYVTSSWRNAFYPELVEYIKKLGHDVYDFRNPPNRSGFGWEQINEDWQCWDTDEYKKALTHPLAVAGFDADFSGMKWADCCVIVLPCGRSAHTEAGWFAGQGKPVFAFVPIMQEPELMYKIFHGISKNYGELREQLFSFKINKNAFE